jgi:hypothetical protein
MSLRERLHEISEAVAPHEHNAAVVALADEYPHSISVVPSIHPNGAFTCLMHVFGFTGQQKYLAVAQIPPCDVFAGRPFAHWLLQKRILDEVAGQDAQNGDLVLYFDSHDVFQHAGLLRGDRVESKWGTQGLYEHGFFEVPSTYGNTLGFFKQLPYEEAIEWFYDFAEENGIEFRVAP